MIDRLNIDLRGTSRRWLKTIICLWCISFTVTAGAQQSDSSWSSLKWELGPTGSRASLRGLAAPSDQVIWACGSGATVLRSVDGGSAWESVDPEQYDELEFRSIHAWDDETAIIASAGTPAIVLFTANGGQEWREVYRNTSTSAFFDALRFWDDLHGIAFSDPVDGKLLIIESSDGGLTWNQVSRELIPDALPGEAGFAASNSSLTVRTGGEAWIGLGGTESPSSRILYRPRTGAAWETIPLPLPSAAAQGIFSLAVANQTLVAVGGDYRPEAESPATACILSLADRSSQLPKHGPAAYSSAVIAAPIHSPPSRRWKWLSVGPSGSDVSIDANAWYRFTDVGFHALAMSPNFVYACGSDGRFAILRDTE